jgi:hypothetical protein
MPNSIKYNVSTQTSALKKGNFWIGTGDVSKGPTVNTDYWNGITPPTGGYTIYLNKASNGPSIYVAANDSELISLTNRIASTSYTTVNECFNYYASQTDKMVLNRDYESIVSDGLIFNLDAGFIPSYPRNSITWYDISGINNGTLTNGPTFDSNNGGSIVFDGVDDITKTTSIATYSNTQTWVAWVRRISSVNSLNIFMGRLKPYFAFRSDNQFQFSNQIGGVQVNLLSGVTYSSNIWYFTCFTTEYQNPNTIMKMYINGTLVNSGTFSGVQNNYSLNFTIGDYIDTAISFPFNGHVSMVLVYNRTLSTSEINQNYYATLNNRMIVTNGLVFNLQAGNLSSYPGSGTVWKDVSSNASSSGILTNGPTFNSSDGGSIVFDGVNDAVIWNSNPLSSLTSAKTYDVWVKFDSTIVNTFTISCGTYKVYLENKNTWYVNQTGASNSFLSWTFSAGWTNFVYSFDGTNHLCYINGTSRTINFGSGVGSQTNLYIGNRVNMDSPMKGNIASTRLYNRGLSETEILQNYNATKGSFGL